MKKAALLGIAAIFLAGCSTGIIRSQIEKGIRDSLPEHIGPARKYKVHVSGSESAMMDGRINRLLIEGTGVQINDDLSVDRMSIIMDKVRFNPRTHAVKGVESTTFEAELSSETLNSFISKVKDDKYRVKIRLYDGKAVVDAAPGLLGIRVPVSVTGSPVIREGNKADFVADEASLSIIPLPASIINKLFKEVNPVLDMSQMKFPIIIEDITIEKDLIIVKGRAEFALSNE